MWTGGFKFFTSHSCFLNVGPGLNIFNRRGALTWESLHLCLHQPALFLANSTSMTVKPVTTRRITVGDCRLISSRLLTLSSVLSFSCRRAFQEYYQEHLEYACPTEDIYLE